VNQILELSAFFSSLIYLFFASKKRAKAWIFGSIAALLSVILFYRIQLNSSFILNVIYFFMGIAGYFNWKLIENEKPFKYHYQPLKHVLLSLAMFGIFVIIQNIDVIYFKTSFQKIDLFLSLFSVLATFLEIKKDRACWWYWISINIGFTVLYWSQSLPFYSALMSIFTVFSVYALYQWKHNN